MKINFLKTEMKVDSPTEKIEQVFESNDKVHPIEEFLLYHLPFFTADLTHAIAFDKADGVVQRKLQIVIDY